MAAAWRGDLSATVVKNKIEEPNVSARRENYHKDRKEGRKRKTH